jgi:hypothetical protein
MRTSRASVGQALPEELPESAYFDPADCGGTFDGFNVTSDAAPGL